MLELSEKTKVAQGSEREVHIVPGDKNLLVKVDLSYKPDEIHFFNKFFNSYFSSHNRLSKREIKEDMRARSNARSIGLASPIVPTRGLIQTSRGMGLLVDRIGPKTGGLAPTLSKLRQEKKITPKTLKQLNVFAKSVFELGVIIDDLQPENILWNKATNTFLIADGFGDKNFIKLKTYISYFRNRNQNKKFNKIAGKLGLKWQPKEQRFSF